MSEKSLPLLKACRSKLTLHIHEEIPRESNTTFGCLFCHPSRLEEGTAGSLPTGLHDGHNMGFEG